MLLPRVVPLFGVIAAISACAAETSDSPLTTSDEALGASSSPSPSPSRSPSRSRVETFTLEPEAPRGGALDRCEARSFLSLAPPIVVHFALDATLHDERPTGCDAIAPDLRSYHLLYDGARCGSKTYSATGTIDGAERTLTLIDHRLRTCKDVVPASIVVEETSSDGVVRRLYARVPSV